MRRSLSIVICSAYLLAPLHASRLYFGNNSCAPQAGSGQVFYHPSGSSGFTVGNSGVGPVITGSVRAIYFTPTLGTQRIYGSLTNSVANYVFSSGEHNLFCQNTNQPAQYTGDPWNGGVKIVTETNSFNWQFGAEWSDSLVQVRIGTNNVFSGFVPTGGGSVFGSVITNNIAMSNAMVYIDGVSVIDLATSKTNASLDAHADRPGYSFNFDESYSGGEWQARRADGSIAASGSAATLGSVVSGRMTVVPDGSFATIYTRVPAGDGLGSAWISSGVTVGGNGVTSYSFVNRPGASDPSPLPTPAPVSSATPVPTQPGTNNVSSPVVTNPTNPEDNVSVDVGELELGDLDDGEDGVLQTLGDLQQAVRDIVENISDTQENMEQAADHFSGLRLGGSGSNCQISIGPANVTIATNGAVRAGLTLLVIGIAAFGAAGMIRNAVQ